MTYKLLALAASSVLISATASFANTTMVNCDGYVVSMSDEIAIQGQAKAGTVAGFEKAVCDRSSDLAQGAGEGATIIPVFVEELGVATRAVIFKPEE